MGAAEKSYGTLGAVMDKSFEEQLEDFEKAGATVRRLRTEEVVQFEIATKYKDVQNTWGRPEDAGFKRRRCRHRRSYVNHDIFRGMTTPAALRNRCDVLVVRAPMKTSACHMTRVATALAS
ncbi:hypothetical protein [Pararhizobium sp. DWP3-4]|uniref:hypothetical protein n=1 Tax=unclassified Pararhizobium TaxID=2643050 RepID=UPI003CF33732